jgi:hypothetical protein
MNFDEVKIEGRSNSLQATSKQLEGSQHADRDGQFRHINDTVVAFLAEGQPVVSVDTKEKLLVGDYSNAGREWQPKGKLTRTKVHHFIDPEMGKAFPHGVYGLGADEGWVSVAEDADTAGLCRLDDRGWWAQMGPGPLPAGHKAPHLRRCRRLERLPGRA